MVKAIIKAAMRHKGVVGVLVLIFGFVVFGSLARYRYYEAPADSYEGRGILSRSPNSLSSITEHATVADASRKLDEFIHLFCSKKGLHLEVGHPFSFQATLYEITQKGKTVIIVVPAIAPSEGSYYRADIYSVVPSSEWAAFWADFTIGFRQSLSPL